MYKTKTDFWLEDYKCLFSDITIIPQNRYSIDERFNILSRLIIIISLLVMLFLDLKLGIIFLLLSLVVIISIYYSKDKNVIVQENFQFINNLPNDKKMERDPKIYLDNVFTTVKNPTKFPPESNLFCGSEQILTNNQSQWTLNQQLANGTVFMSDLNCGPNTILTPQIQTSQKLVNKNTLKPPIIAPPIWDLNSWRDNDFVNYSRINDQRIMDKYRSGYYVQQCPCEDWTKNDHSNCLQSKQRRTQQRTQQEIEPVVENYSYQYQKDNISPVQYPQAKPYPYVNSVDVIEDQSYLQPGDILTCAGYNPNNLKSNLPSNAAFGTCEKDPVFDEYNKDMYTQTIQPGFYSRSQIIEPISSNIGISFDQQFLPTTINQEGNNYTFVEHDPRQFKPGKPNVYTQGVSEDNVYDPRHSGYGTSYRSYIDKITGQPRFYYDDINAIRRPNFIVRSKIDTFDFGETYGPMKDNETINRNDCDIRQKAQQKFLDDSIGFRTDLQQSLMRKRNNEMAQLRKFPLSRAGQRVNRGGGSGGSGGANGGTNI